MNELAANPRRGTLRQRFLVFALAHLVCRYQALIATRKQALLSQSSGLVLEIGPGTGANLHYYPQHISWIGVEPNPSMFPYIRNNAALHPFNVELRLGTAEQIPVADQTIDTVASTLVLCSVSDVEKTLHEIMRILKPGGKFIFLEHVAAPRGTTLRSLQRLFRPFSLFLAECHPDRETWTNLEQAGFAQVQLEHFRVPIPIDSPHISGIATKSV